MASRAPARKRDALIEVVIDPHIERGTQAFKDARKNIKSKVKSGLQKAATDVALPAVKRAAPYKTGRLRSHLTAKARANDAYITVTGGQKMRYAGLLEFGGVIRGEIKPKKQKALTIGDGFAADVTKPRKYEPREYIRRALIENKSGIIDALNTEVREAFIESGFEG